MLLAADGAELAEVAGRDPLVVLVARLKFIGDAVEGVGAPHASLAEMKSSPCKVSRDSFAIFSAWTNHGSLVGAFIAASLLLADAGREPATLLGRE